MKVKILHVTSFYNLQGRRVHAFKNLKDMKNWFLDEGEVLKV